MRRRTVALLVLGLAVAVGCKGKKPSGTDPAPDNAPPPGGGKSVAKNGRGTFTIGKATTYVTGPIDADGYIDYAAALNERLSKGVTPQNNANVLIWRAIGEKPPPGYFEKLGIPAPSAKGDYFTGLRQYSEQHTGPGSANAAFDTLARLGSRPWTANEQPAIANWLKANEKPLELVVEAAGRTHYYNPIIPGRTDKGSSGLISTLLPGAQAAREVAGALAARAMLHTGQGQADAAWQDLLTCHRLGRIVGRGGTLLEGLVGIAIEQLACRADLAFLDRTQPDAKRIEGCLRDLAGLPTVPGVVEKIDVTERFMWLDHVMQLDRQGVAYLAGIPEMGAEARNLIDDGMLAGINWDPALEAANQWFDRITAALRQKGRVAQVRELDKIQAELRALKPNATGQARLQQFINEGKEIGKAKGQAVGEVFLSVGLPAAWKVQDAHDRVAQLFENVAAAFALAWYQRENGKYPDKPDALAKYLGREPIDLFSGGNLIYRPAANGYLLYSVGVNGKDDGGRGPEDQPPGDDIVVRMPVPGGK